MAVREGQMDAEWLVFARPKRKQRKQRSDKGSSKKWAPDGLFDRVPEGVNVNDLDEFESPAADDLGRIFQDADGARSPSAGCAEQRREADTRMDSPSGSPDRSVLHARHRQ